MKITTLETLSKMNVAGHAESREHEVSALVDSRHMLNKALKG